MSEDRHDRHGDRIGDGADDEAEAKAAAKAGDPAEGGTGSTPGPEAREHVRRADGDETDDFAPLRVRPYVTLPEPSQPLPPRVCDPYARPPAPTPAYTGAAAPHDDEDPEPPARRAPVLLLAAIAGVLSAVALVSVLIMSGGDDASTVDTAASTATLPAEVPESATRSASAASSPPSHAPSPSPSASAPSATPSPTASRTPTSSPSATRSASASPTASPSASRTSAAAAPTVLQRGDHGPEVAELQGRLKQLALYMGEPNGNFNGMTEFGVRNFQMARGVRGDAPGTYGPATRQALEAETTG
ncbi:peptidoglycan-binding protein [Streptomyces sp. SID8379]|uniref:peptidoglycan-binding domain-containing protein n=1 Tax=unclassified Streptomyces TaxID=2593676 RepID=UPI00035D5C97|nr:MULTISPECIES: peptidoglycan-binding domain-containing protein [unclassified Streptomyces]MYW64465.1 peptidoglycan-binding protein [Streptomyces sp. SID8379]